ncbi:MAG: hypothetical protein WAM78_08465 [Candidatus Sulfotelmatobacter sp.]
MTRINLFLAKPSYIAPSTLSSVSWGKSNYDKTNFERTNHTNTNFDTTASTLVFAALLIACSLAVGCSSENSKPVTTSQPPIAQPVTMSPAPSPVAPVLQATAKPPHRKVVRKAPATVTYTDKTFGVSFEYPRKYALETGGAATELVASTSIPMDFVQPGGIALAAVALPDSTYANSDMASAFFNVSVNKTLTADQCREFSVPQPNPAAPADPAIEAKAEVATPPISKLMIGDMELQSAETSATQDSREEVSKYYHVFENGACYEFAMKVATKTDTTSEGATTKHVDRDEVFQRLEKLLATVKMIPVTPEVNAEVKTNVPPALAGAPAQ